MKERELSSIIIQLNELLLSCNALMGNSGAMDNAEKKYGFYLMKIPSDNYKSGYYYAVRYKDPESKKWIPTKKSTDTDDEILAKSFAIENKETIIQEYKNRKAKREKKINDKEFYKMLEEYYQENSKYLQDDSVNNKRFITKKQRDINNGFIHTYLIPYLKEKNINSIQEINTSVYSSFKIYLQDKMAAKSINNNLIGFNRILQYHERNELIQKLPYTRGTGQIKLSKEDKAKSRQPALLPTEFLTNIFTNIHFDNGKEPLSTSFMLALIGLTTGMRDSEIARIKREDIKYIKSENAYYVKAYNHKNDYHNRAGTDEYRKIPLHSFIIEMLKTYIQFKGKEKTDYIFGSPKLNEDTKQTDGHLHPKHFRKAIVEFYKRIKIKEKLQETGDVFESLNIDVKAMEEEMKEKRIVFYSFRHTFQTLLATKYKGQTLLIDYYMGHRPIQTMLANYLHINQVDEKTFWNEYGKLLIDFQSQFIPAENKEQRKLLKDYIEKKLKENGFKPELETENTKNIFDIIGPLMIKKEVDTDNQNDRDDFFESV